MAFGNQELRMRGGARIGWVNMTWPFAYLEVTRDKMTISGFAFDNYTFDRSQVVSLRRYWGAIRVDHTRPDYPQKIFFGGFCFPKTLLRRIEEIGFIPSGRPEDQVCRRGIAFRWQAIVFVVLVWNILFLLDMSENPGFQGKPGIFSFAALIFLFLVSVTPSSSEKVRKMLLKPDRSLKEVQSFLVLLGVVSGLMMAFFGLSLFVK